MVTTGFCLATCLIVAIMMTACAHQVELDFNMQNPLAVSAVIYWVGSSIFAIPMIAGGIWMSKTKKKLRAEELAASKFSEGF